MKKILLSISVCLFFAAVSAQTNTDKKQTGSQRVTAFKSTRIINAHSSEMLAPGTMDFRLLHRFGKLNQGVKQFFGLDQAAFRMAFDYGISRDVMVGIGRSTLGKELDAFLKVRLMQQTTGENERPLSLLLASGVLLRTGVSTDIYTPDPTFIQRSSAYFQMIAARKFSDKFSFQLSPILLIRNRVYVNEDNATFALGGGARYNVSRKIALTADYHNTIKGIAPGAKNPLSLGIDIETGGHVFQLHFSNSSGLSERAYLTETSDDFFKGDIRFGFNLSRIFYVNRRK